MAKHEHGPGCDHDHGHEPAHTHDHGPSPEPLRRAQPKVGRNEPCPCGSTKKFKKCCGLAA
jgi:uncharacterized protein YecA (UPF0149 family)